MRNNVLAGIEMIAGVSPLGRRLPLAKVQGATAWSASYTVPSTEGGLVMRKLLLGIMLVGALGALADPQPADAQLTGCLGETIAECDARFPATSEILVAIRGWCYMIGWAICKAF